MTNGERIKMMRDNLKNSPKDGTYEIRKRDVRNRIAELTPAKPQKRKKANP